MSLNETVLNKWKLEQKINIEEEAKRARTKAMFSSFENDSMDLIAIMSSSLKPKEFEDLIGLVYNAKDSDEADEAIKDFYNYCY